MIVLKISADSRVCGPGDGIYIQLIFLVQFQNILAFGDKFFLGKGIVFLDFRGCRVVDV